MLEYKSLRAGDCAIVVEFGERSDRRLNSLVIALAERLRHASIDGVIEIVPTFRSLLVQYDPLRIVSAWLIGHIERIVPDLRVIDSAGRHWHLPICYDPELAPDLKDVADRCNLTIAQVIERHEVVYETCLGRRPSLCS